MRTDANTITKVLRGAADGLVPNEENLRAAGVFSVDHGTVRQAAVMIASISVGGEATLAKSYAAEVARELTTPDEELEDLFDNWEPGNPMSDRTVDHQRDHPAHKILREVANGRSAPTAERLGADFRIPAEMVEPLSEAARMVAAARRASSGTAAASLAGSLAGPIVVNHPHTPEPHDDWADYLAPEPEPDIDPFEGLL